MTKTWFATVGPVAIYFSIPNKRSVPTLIDDARAPREPLGADLILKLHEKRSRQARRQFGAEE